MAFLTVLPRSVVFKRALLLGGICSCVVVIMYTSSAPLFPQLTATISTTDQFLLSPSTPHWSNAFSDDQATNEPDKLVPVSFDELERIQPPQMQNQDLVHFSKNPRTERDSESDDLKVLHESNENISNGQPKKILLWNAYWGSKALWHKIFAEIIHKQCPQSNCVLTTNHSQLNASDAVLFHLVDFVSGNYSLPQNRDPNQIWIGMSYEPPYILQFIGLDFKRLNGLFNRTMSYRTDGDIVVRHGTYSKLQYPIPSASTYVSNWVNSHDPVDTRNYAEGKHRLVAWFASSRNCNSQSGRENYITELQNYIQVDIYGSCGPYKCGVQKTMRHPYKVEEDDCYRLVSMGYKFVLAFENSLCEDYVTEKLYNNLKLNVVPVVLGASNYSMFAPPYSVIEAGQYTPEALAQYLQYLDKNDTAYNEYFRWKQDYQVEAHDGVPLACDLCEQLHNPNWQVERKVYDQFDKWIVGGCRKGYEKFS